MNNLEIITQQQLIPVGENENGEVIVNARGVYEFLKVQQDFSDWIKKQLEMIGAKEDKEYSLLKGETSKQGGRPTTEYVLTLDVAKEICMIAGVAPRTNEETKKLSKQARQYFIAIEKAWNSPEMIMKRALEIANRNIAKLTFANSQKDQIIGELKPKADYTDTILKNKGLVNIGQIAKDYGMSATEMNKKLHELKVQYKQSGQWLLYSSHQAKGYTHSKTTEFRHKDGSPDVKMNTAWTQKGRIFIYNLLKDNGILPVIEREVKEAI